MMSAEAEKGCNMKTRKTITLSMILYELRNVTGNPFVHIFGVGMPTLMSILIIRVAVSEAADASLIKMISTSVFLGIGTLIPMATILMGYSVMQAQEMEKGIPERMQLFGITNRVSVCNRIISELIFMAAAYVIYFFVGIFFIGLKAPVFSGVVWYFVCTFIFSVLCFILAHAIATLAKKFGITYCVVMLLYFAFMIFGGGMGISYENMSGAMQAVAKLIPVTYFNKDFYLIWTGESYNFGPMIQSYLFFGAASGILLLIALKRGGRKSGEKHI